MKVLILTCNTGEGHNSVASAVQESFAAHSVSCRTVDALSFLSERASNFACRVHTQMYRHVPAAWRTTYRRLEQHPPSQDGSLLVRILSLGAKDLYEFIKRDGYDCLICPHPFPALMVTSLRNMHPELAVYASFVSTDYTCFPYVDICEMDRYYFPSSDAAAMGLAAGIPSERITVTPGVPVRAAFFERIPKAEARRRMGLPQGGRLILLMGGSMGCGHLDEVAEHLAAHLPAGDSMVVACGTNNRLREKLERTYVGRPGVYVWGYWEDMSLLMDAADIYVTKPGGVSTSEAAVKGLPMVLEDVVSACEEPNQRYFCRLGGAVSSSEPEELAAMCLRLLDEESQLAKMSAALTQRENAADVVCAMSAQDMQFLYDENITSGNVALS